MSETYGMFNWVGRCLVSTLVLAMFGCADAPGRNDSTGTAQTTDRSSSSDRPVTTPPAQGTGAAAGSAPSTQQGEVSSRLPGESEGQRLISEQSQKQREIESTSRTEQAPGSIAPKTCADFPGFDRGCPGGGTR
jgi:hypothetical protein